MYPDLGGTEDHISAIERARRISRRRVLRLLDVSDDTLRKWIKAGVFPEPMRMPNKRHRWQLGEVLDWLDEQGRKPAREAA